MADASRTPARAGLPGVEETGSDGFDFRVTGKGFASSYPERKPGQPRRIRIDIAIAVLCVGDEAGKQSLLLSERGLFFTAPGYESWPLVLLRLAAVEVQRLSELVTDAWRRQARKRWRPSSTGRAVCRAPDQAEQSRRTKLAAHPRSGCAPPED
jgi:hypothetical protein